MSRVVLGCFEVPGWGGLTTATYRLFETMLEDGLDVCYLNLIRDVDVDRFRRQFGPDFDNPRRLPSVHTCRLEAALHEPQPGLSALLAALEPACVVGAGDIATYLMKRAAPAVPTVLLTGGCMQVDTRIPFTEQGIPSRDAGNGHAPPTHDWKEREAVGMADRIVTHSDMIRDVYRHFYSEDAHKIEPRVIWFAEWIHREASEHAGHALLFDERDVDALFIASSWTREEKNVGLVTEIAGRLEEASVHVVGEVATPIPGVTHHGILARDDLFRLMGRAKTVVSPSSFDAAPGILFEASAMGCNVVASHNCGNWMLCHPDLLAEPYTADAFAQRIRRARERKLPDHMADFLGSGSYRELTRIVTGSDGARLEVLLPPAASRVVSHQTL